MNCDSKDSNAVSKLGELEKVNIDFEHYVKRADKAEKEIEDLTKTIQNFWLKHLKLNIKKFLKNLKS